MAIDFDAGYGQLPARFYARVSPTPVASPSILKVNRPLAELLGIDPDALDSPEGAQKLAGNQPFEGSDPLATAYAGHQFGHFVPQLGDGRAILLGDVMGRDGVAREVQLKGAGPTPFSRGGDGRAAIGPVLREYLVSEAMAALGIPTTRALAAVATGEPVYRERPLPGAVLTRVATSHLRVGTFEYFAARRDHDAIAQLVDHALARHYPNARHDVPALALLDAVTTAQAELVARWLGVGFVHGVMNTDNCSIAGETIDYGPCAFLDAYDPQRVFSSIDRGGRYAFEQQPKLAMWNLARLAEALLPLVSGDEAEAICAEGARRPARAPSGDRAIEKAIRGEGARGPARAPSGDRAIEKAIRAVTEVLESFPARFEAAHAAVLRPKLGLLVPKGDDLALAKTLFEHMAKGRVDFTRFFRWLALAAESDAHDAQLRGLFPNDSRNGSGNDSGFAGWLETWRARLNDEPTPAAERAAAMRRASPAFIPRNHRVEEMIEAATRGDLDPFERLLDVLSRPYDDQPEHDELAEPPGDEQWSYRTFCGT